MILIYSITGYYIIGFKIKKVKEFGLNCSINLKKWTMSAAVPN